MTRPLVLAPVSLFGLPPDRMIEAAAAAGFDGVGLRINEIRPGVPAPDLRPGGALHGRTRAALRDTGLVLFDMEVFWLKPDTDPSAFAPLIEIGRGLGAREMLVALDPMEQGRDVDLLGRLCETADLLDTGVSLEFMSWSGVPGLPACRDLVDRVARDNLHILPDALHLDRSGGRPADLAGLDPRRLAYAQVCDAGPDRPASPAALLAEAISARRLPGEGVLPLTDYIAALPPDLPLSLEVPMQALAGLSDAEKARRAMAALRAVLPS